MPQNIRSEQLHVESFHMRRFIPALTKFLDPFHKLIKKNVQFLWARSNRKPSRKSGCCKLTSNHDFTCQKFSPNSLLTYTNKSIGALLSHEVNGVRHPLFDGASLSRAHICHLETSSLFVS